MKLTTIFKFKKPDGTDTVNIQDINDNFDVVETVLKRTDEAQAGTKATLVDGDKVVILDSADGAKKLTTWEQVVAAVKTAVGSAYAAATHKHSAADVTSGTLGLARGGTGATTAATARTALGACTKVGPTVVTVSTSWSGSGPWTQTVTVSGVTANDTGLGVYPVDTTDAAARKLYEEAYGCLAAEAETVAGGIKLTCRDKKPTISLQIKVQGVR